MRAFSTGSVHLKPLKILLSWAKSVAVWFFLDAGKFFGWVEIVLMKYEPGLNETSFKWQGLVWL